MLVLPKKSLRTGETPAFLIQGYELCMQTTLILRNMADKRYLSHISRLAHNVYEGRIKTWENHKESELDVSSAFTGVTNVGMILNTAKPIPLLP
mmetsp:Transcript_11242/g.23887  ORF Transcript_11242/g.23887 Transcript_11242/m.23887 type:complete len:94 (+) Transcript_11242:410-691(+)